MFLAAGPAFFAQRNPDGLFPPATQARPYWGLGFQGGVYYRPNAQMSVGASYKTKQWFETFEYNSKTANGTARKLSFELEFPAILSLGVGYYGIENTTIAFDLRHFSYGNTKGFGGAGFSGKAFGRSPWARSGR
jgi:long-chain fatty acid transport protein